MAVNLSLFAGAGAQFFDNNGSILSGGLIYSYAAGTTTLAITYTALAGTIANTNPIVLDSAGRVPNEIWLTDGQSYKFIVKTSSGVTLGTYDNIVGAADTSALTTFKALLASPVGSSLIGYQPYGTASTPITVQSKLRQTYSIEDFRVSSDVVGADTGLVQRAFDSGKSIYFTQNYFVDSVIASSIGQSIDFNGYTLTGTRAAGGAAAQYVMGITGRYMKMYSVNINANFGAYGSCVRWFSVSNALPAQNNSIYGMLLAYCVVGLTFGQDIGSPSVNAAQSENTIYKFNSRGLQTPFVGNQTNGFVTFISPILDCNSNEWVSQPGFNATTWGTNALTINNVVGQVTIIGGELLKTFTQLGYGIRGSGILVIGAALEIACSQAYVLGSIVLRDTTNGYMSSDSAPAFVISSGATGTLSLLNMSALRGVGVSSYSSALFVSYESTSNAFNVVIETGIFIEWTVQSMFGRTVSFISAEIIAITGGASITANDNNNCLLRQNGVNTLIYETTGWYYVSSSGAGSMTIGTSAPTGKNASSLELTTSGLAYANTGDVTSTTTIKNTCLAVIPDEYYHVDIWAKATGTCTISIVYFDIAGTQITSTVLVPTITSSWVSYLTIAKIPATAAYILIQGSATAGTLNLTDFSVTRFVKPA